MKIGPGVSELWGSKIALSHWQGQWLIQQLVLPYKPWCIYLLTYMIMHKNQQWITLSVLYHRYIIMNINNLHMLTHKSIIVYDAVTLLLCLCEWGLRAIDTRIQTADFVGSIRAIDTTVTSVHVVDAFTTATLELISRTSWKPTAKISITAPIIDSLREQYAKEGTPYKCQVVNTTRSVIYSYETMPKS